jgi:hypothetical protein
MSFTACKQKRPSSAANRNSSKPCMPAARWNGSPSRRNRAEPKCRLRRRLPSRQRAAGGPAAKLAVAGDRGFESTRGESANHRFRDVLDKRLDEIEFVGGGRYR